MRPEKNRNTSPCIPPADPEAVYEETSMQIIKTRVSTSNKLPGTDRVTPPLETPLVENGASIEDALIYIADSIGVQNEKMSLRMSELERAVHVDRESLQEVTRSEKRLKERTDDHLAKNL